MYRILISYIIFIPFVLNIIAQDNCTICKQEVMELRSYMQAIKSGKTIKMKLEVNTNWIDKGKKHTNIESFELIRSRDYIFNKGQKIEYYVDRKDAFVVLRTEKLIHKINFSLAAMEKSLPFQQNEKINLQKKMRLDTCYLDSTNRTRAVFVPFKNNNYGMISIQIVCKQIEPERMIFTYKKNKTVQTMRFLNTSIVEQGDQNAVNEIFDKKGILRKRFAGYTFKDYTNATN